MGSRKESVPAQSTQAEKIPLWLDWCHPDLRPYQNAVIVVARLRGFSFDGKHQPAGIRRTVWEYRLAATFLSLNDGDNEAAVRDTWESVGDIEDSIIRTIRAVANESYAALKGGGA